MGSIGKLIPRILVTLAIAAAIPGGVRRAATWRSKSFELTDFVHIENYMLPMGLAMLTIAALGLIITWTGFRKYKRTAWISLALIAVLFYFPVLFRPGFPPDIWLPRLSDFFVSSLVRELALQFFGFFCLLAALLLTLRGAFWKSSEASGPSSRSEGGE